MVLVAAVLVAASSVWPVAEVIVRMGWGSTRTGTGTGTGMSSLLPPSKRLWTMVVYLTVMELTLSS